MIKLTIQILSTGGAREQYHSTGEVQLSAADLVALADQQFFEKYILPTLTSAKNEFFAKSKAFEKKHPGEEKNQ